MVILGGGSLGPLATCPVHINSIPSPFLRCKIKTGSVQETPYLFNELQDAYPTTYRKSNVCRWCTAWVDWTSDPTEGSDAIERRRKRMCWLLSV